MGKFMLAFTIFWAYIGFSQYMLIWYANIPEETIYFRIRNTEILAWYFSQFLVIGRFFLPFPILLFQWTKKNPKLINAGSPCWILFMQFLDIYVIVLPALHQTGFSPSIFDLSSRSSASAAFSAGSSSRTSASRHSSRRAIRASPTRSS